MRTIRLTPKAQADLGGVWLYSRERWSEEQANQYYIALTDAFETLLVDAGRGTPVEVRAGYRKLLAGSHVIYFRSIRAGIEIVRILHQAMDVRRHL